MFTALHQLPLPQMFVVVFASCLAICWIVIAAVRIAIRLSGFELSEMLPIKDSIIGACTTIFALIVAFSAAGIWNDGLAARNASQREADAIENAYVLSAALPSDVREALHERLRSYATSVVTDDWPQMEIGTPLDGSAYEHSERILLDAIEILSQPHATVEESRAYAPPLNQLLEARHARLARLAAANSGVSWAQWIAMMLISTTALIAIATCNSHSFGMQVTATHFYVVVISAAYFVILAHDRPFTGHIAVKPTAFQSFIKL